MEFPAPGRSSTIAPRSLSEGPEPHFGEGKHHAQVQIFHPHPARLGLAAAAAWQASLNRRAECSTSTTGRTTSPTARSKNFEKETGIKVRYDDIYDANEILRKGRAGGRPQRLHDIVCSRALGAFSPRPRSPAACTRKLDRAQLTIWGNLDPGAARWRSWRTSTGNEHLVTWMWGYVTVGINTAKVKAALGATPMPANPWSLIFDPQYANKLKELRHQRPGLGLRK
ncbi:MAG: hypothetical protein IPI51_13685 [Betaproteobacteria bacterium]|nr:hypothetical protein [Betaproteobacteria bacterium]